MWFGLRTLSTFVRWHWKVALASLLLIGTGLWCFDWFITLPWDR